jgi:bacillithiol biosynthesis deacetylase BshB1
VKPTDALFFGPHPDDVEIAASGTVLRLGAAGRRISFVDATRGEKGSRGTVQDRDAESAAASRLLGLLERHNLDLPDTQVAVDEPSTRALVEVLRSARPALFFAPVAQDQHPDHTAAAHLAERAMFLAGLANYAPELGAPFRPSLLIRYPGNRPIEPTIVVDISDFQDQKAAVLRCYASQIAPADRQHLLQRLDVLERSQVRDRFHGARVGVAAAEPFWLDGPLPLHDPDLLFAGRSPR